MDHLRVSSDSNSTNKEYNLCILSEGGVENLDTAGTKTFTVVHDLYISNGQGFVIVYSITSQGIFDQLHQIYNQIMTTKKEQPALVVMGNKVDLSDMERVVHREKGRPLADQRMCPFL